MVVEKKEMTAEEKNAETDQVAAEKRKVTNAVIASLELPVKEEKPGEEEEEEEPKPGEEEEEKPGEVEGDISDADLLETADEDLTAEGLTRKRELEKDPSKAKKAVKKEEDLIPKSKVDKILKKQERRIESAMRRAKAAESKSSESKDPDTARLERMSTEKVRETKRKARRAALKAQSDGDEDRVDALLELEDKCDQVIQGAPQKFVNAQLELFQDKAEEIEQDPDIEDFDKAAPIILQLAKEIYAKYPKLQTLVEGQVMALESAVDRYKLMQKALTGKEKTRYLKQAVSKFKRKTNLDTADSKGKMKISQRLKNLRAKAFRGGDLTDKANLIKEDPRFGIDQLLPDELKGE